MGSSLLHQLAPVHKDQRLRGVGSWGMDTVNKLCEDDLVTLSSMPRKTFGILTVLPLPVARDMPNLLWPLCMYESTDWMHSS